MSKMSELAYNIEQLYIEGLSPRQIATELECPITTVLEWLDSQGVDA
jgi:DNA-directed RNA polymerase specialized sigma24 family protein